MSDYYHGSSRKFDKLNKGSWITPYKDDALSFGVPWGSKDLKYTGDASGRPPSIDKLDFHKDAIPSDSPLYLYLLKNPKTVKALTNTGRQYHWNKQITEDTPVQLIQSHTSWKDMNKHKEAFMKSASEYGVDKDVAEAMYKSADQNNWQQAATIAGGGLVGGLGGKMLAMSPLPGKAMEFASPYAAKAYGAVQPHMQQAYQTAMSGIKGIPDMARAGLGQAQGAAGIAASKFGPHVGNAVNYLKTLITKFR